MLEDVKDTDVSSSEEVESDVSQDQETPDYKTEFEKLQEKYEREKELRQYERERRKALERRKEEQPEESKATDVEALIEQRLSKLQVDQREDIIEDMLARLSDDESEREIIRLKYDNELKHSGYTRSAIEADLKKSKLLANAARFESEIEERAKAKVKKSMAEAEAMKLMSGTISGGAPMEEAPIKLSPEEKRFLERFGATERYKSKLKNKQ